jgi:D-alanyl-lipoteichoic acid acyltransferase DltB (MBOAT superfamily)
MIFTSPLFVLFLVLILLGYWLIIAIKFVSSVKVIRNSQLFMDPGIFFLLLSSLLFYSAWNPRYLSLLLWVSGVDYWLAGQISQGTNEKYRKRLLVFSLCNSLGVLAIFKYLGFFQENLFELIQLLGWESHREMLRFVLPVGISFYIFQSISYVVDVYRRILPAEKNYLNYLFYLSFFPQLVAGPIVQAKDFLPQIHNLLPFPKIQFRFALFLILLGAFKKSVLADHLAVTSDFSFSHVEEVDREFLWLGFISYTGQIYCDFSGYTDIAQGTALLFGFRLPENFRMPYLASGFSDFWRRWHISLSGWLKNYLYIPLGGSKEGSIRTHFNLILVMLLGGLWHGASWNFVIWGFGHGVLLNVERVMKVFLSKIVVFKKWSESRHIMIGFRICYVALTLFCVSILWIFFRSPKFTDSLWYLQGLFIKKGTISIPYTQGLVTYWCLFAIAVGHMLGQRYFKDNEHFLFAGSPDEQTPVMLMLTGALFSLGFIGVVLLSGNSLPFVYFVF